MMPFFSVFVSIYNGEKFLPETIASLTNQSFRDFNVFWIDDGSSDHSRELIENCGDSRFILRCKKNEGSVPFSWRYVMPLLDGKYVQYMSQDDVLEKDYFKKMYETIQKHSEPDAVISSVEYWKNESNNRIDAGWKGSFDHSISGRIAYEAALDYSIPGFCCWKTELIRSIPLVCDAFNSDELMQRLWFLNSQKVVFSKALFRYRQNNPDAITKKFSPKHYSSLKTNIHLMDSMLKNNVSPSIVKKLCSEYYMGLFALYRVYQNEKKSYTEAYRKECIQLFKEAFMAFHKYGKFCSSGGRRVVFRISAISFRILAVLTWLLK